MPDTQLQTTELLQALVRFNTVNPPGNERPAIEYLDAYVSEAGFETEILGHTDARANLIATLDSGLPGPTLVYLGHVDTVLAEPADWKHDPWSGEVAEGHVWGRGALDMKSQVAAEAVAGAVLGHAGWRPARGKLKLVFVADEETGGELGAQWLTRNHPDKVRADLLINEGAGAVFEYGSRRHYGVCCAEKGIFRFTLTAHGTAGHASLPRGGDNALVKLGPVLTRLAAIQPSYDVTEAPAALLAALGEDPAEPEVAITRIATSAPALGAMIEAMLGVTLAPTKIHASDKVNVIPARAELKVDCRVPPGLGEDVARARIAEVLGDYLEALELAFTETIVGNSSPVETTLMGAIERLIERVDPGADAVPLILPGFSDSRWFRDAFPECVAYGFFPQRHQSLLESSPLVHGANERIDVRDLGFATDCYVALTRELLS